MSLNCDYSSLAMQRRTRIFDEKWRLAFKLYQLLGRKALSPLMFVRSFSHYCSARERRRQINMSTFLEAFTKKCDIAPLVLRRVFHTFDAFGQGYIDWRELAFMLTTIGQTQLSPQEDLANAYKFYTGHKSIDVDSPSPKGVPIGEIEKVLTYILTPDKVQGILDIFYDHWGNTIVQSTSNVVLTTDMHINTAVFVELLTKLTVNTQPLLFEEEYYPKLLSRLKRARRFMIRHLNSIVFDALSSSLYLWRIVVQRERTIHSTLLRILETFYNRLLGQALFQLRRFALQNILVIEVQRLFRYRRARFIARLERERHESATVLQSICRQMLAKKLKLQLIWRRNKAAITIQRTFRGYLGRIAAWKLYHTKLLLEETQRQTRLQEIQYNAAVQAAIKLQRYYKSRLAKKQLDQRMKKRRSVLLLSRQMEEHEKQCLLEHAILSKQSAERVEARKTRVLQLQMEGQKLTAQTQLLRERQWKNQEEVNARLKKMKEIEENEMIRSERRKTWQKRIQDEVASYRKYCLQCLKDPQSKADRQFKKHINTLTTKRIDHVLKRANDRGIEIEVKAARKVSQMEVIELLVKERRQTLEKGMKEDLLRLEQELP